MKNNKTNKSWLKKCLYIVATPIGNLDDISERAIRILKEVDFIICENPKHSLKLLNNKGIKKKLIPLHDYNEKKIINKITKNKNNSKIAFISDAGSPLISDPGYRLIKYFTENNYFITAIPGASSVINALQLSGLPIHNFAFFGFVPKQKTKIKQFFDKINNTNLTSVFFVSGKNLKKIMNNIIDFMGEREIAVCKELTKLNEHIFRGRTSEILEILSEEKNLLKGEFTLVVSGQIKKKSEKINKDINKILIKLLKKYNLTEVVKIVHSLTGISRKAVYQIAIKIKDG